MLARRDFLKLSAILATGAVLPTLPWGEAEYAVRPAGGAAPKPVMQLHGHKKSGCAFHPELTDIWAGGGAALPDYL